MKKEDNVEKAKDEKLKKNNDKESLKREEKEQGQPNNPRFVFYR